MLSRLQSGSGQQRRTPLYVPDLIVPGLALRYASRYKGAAGEGTGTGIFVAETPRIARLADGQARLHIPACLLAVLLWGCCAAAYADTPGVCPHSTAEHPEEWEGQNAWQTLAGEGYRIGEVKIVVDEVFDLEDPVEDTWYAKAADALHIDTHPGAIRAELLFKQGEAVNPRVIYESERRLRALPFLRYAAVVPVSCSSVNVDVEVHVKDAWTLKFNLSFAHVGGQSNLNASFEDVDFLGTGKTLKVGHHSDTQRSGNQLSYADPALFGSRWQLDATYAHLSDGSVRAMDLGQPFYEDETPWSLFLHYLDQAQNLNFYDQGNLAWYAKDIQHFDELDWMRLLYWRDGAGMRAGLGYTYQDFNYGELHTSAGVNLPQPALPARRFGGPVASWEYYQDRYATFTNLALIGRAEDYNLGWNAHAQLGYFGDAFGSSAPAWFYAVNGSYGADWHGDTLFLGSASLTGRRETGKYHDVLGNLTFTVYNQSFGPNTLVLHGTVDDTLRPDPEFQLYLGGIQGMPGYPNYFLIGDRRWQLTVEDRVLTQKLIFNTYQVGFSVYTDAGQVRLLETGGWSATLQDAGVALRLGDVRSAYGGVIYVTFAWPLVKMPGADQRQFVIGNIINF